jgi:L-fuculose-phosphate aldolase
MLLPDAREAIVATCRDLSRAGLVVGTAGNVSVREGDLVAVTPSGVRYAGLCDVYLRAASAGPPRPLPPAEIAAVAEKLAGYGQRPPDPAGRLADVPGAGRPGTSQT